MSADMKTGTIRRLRFFFWPSRSLMRTRHRRGAENVQEVEHQCGCCSAKNYITSRKCSVCAEDLCLECVTHSGACCQCSEPGLRDKAADPLQIVFMVERVRSLGA